eukprot:7634-Eustigmatos_ZCMA.PRE.1
MIDRPGRLQVNADVPSRYPVDGDAETDELEVGGVLRAASVGGTLALAPTYCRGSSTCFPPRCVC